MLLSDRAVPQRATALVEVAGIVPISADRVRDDFALAGE